MKSLINDLEGPAAPGPEAPMSSSLKHPMVSEPFKDRPSVSVTGDPGVCGFPCTIRARQSGQRRVSVEIISECKQIRRLAGRLTEVSLRELFAPLTRNPVYIAAEQSGCHASCAIPMAVLKAVEVAMEMALPRDVRVQFDRGEPPDGQK